MALRRFLEEVLQQEDKLGEPLYGLHLKEKCHVRRLNTWKIREKNYENGKINLFIFTISPKKLRRSEAVICLTFKKKYEKYEEEKE